MVVVVGYDAQWHHCLVQKFANPPRRGLRGGPVSMPAQIAHGCGYISDGIANKIVDMKNGFLRAVYSYRRAPPSSMSESNLTRFPRSNPKLVRW